MNEGDEVRIEDLRDLRDLRSRCAALHIPPRLPRGPGKAFLIASDGFWCVPNSHFAGSMPTASRLFLHLLPFESELSREEIQKELSATH